jgi:hypothetical protein
VPRWPCGSGGTLPSVTSACWSFLRPSPWFLRLLIAERSRGGGYSFRRHCFSGLAPDWSAWRRSAPLSLAQWRSTVGGWHAWTAAGLAIGASIRIQDSLQEGTSRFYAEITRLRRIMETAAVGSSVLFLIDEFLHGTNSHDRRIGAEAIVRGLVDRGAIGLVTTHDLGTGTYRIRARSPWSQCAF